MCRNDGQPVLDTAAVDARGRLCEACFDAFLRDYFAPGECVRVCGKETV